MLCWCNATFNKTAQQLGPPRSGHDKFLPTKDAGECDGENKYPQLAGLIPHKTQFQNRALPEIQWSHLSNSSPAFLRNPKSFIRHGPLVRPAGLTAGQAGQAPSCRVPDASARVHSLNRTGCALPGARCICTGAQSQPDRLRVLRDWHPIRPDAARARHVSAS
jgi:hypothetical protein